MREDKAAVSISDLHPTAESKSGRQSGDQLPDYPIARSCPLPTVHYFGICTVISLPLVMTMFFTSPL